MFEGIPLATLTPSALVGVFVLLVFFGALVPWRIYKEKCKEADNWRKAAELKEEAFVTSNAQTLELLELAKTDHKILEALFEATGRSSRSGEANVVPTPTGK